MVLFTSSGIRLHRFESYEIGGILTKKGIDSKTTLERGGNGTALASIDFCRRILR
jgi:hypothetical protein